ncbi:hypothetical protein C4553_01125 [Candidatus Parcubacteria bacterium]|nr:MAG: hypothetical protein C4553_01125 [Candidatus Parcubacteria bacterium]
MRKILAAGLLLCCMAGPVFGEPSVGISEQSKESRAFDKTETRRKTLEQRLSEVKRQADTTTQSMDKSTADQLRRLNQAMQNRSIDIEIPLQALFLDTLLKLENQKPCSDYWPVITKPAFARDFGLSAEIRPGMIDQIKAQYLKDAASSNALISSVDADEVRLKHYIRSMAFYGCVIGQAYLYLQEDLFDLGVDVKGDQKGDISANLAFDDFMTLSEGALKKALSNDFQGPVKALYDAIKRDKADCRFDGQVEKIRCGCNIVTLSGPTQLMALGRNVYGDGGYAGFVGKYRVSSGMSWQKAIEKLESTTKASRFAKEVSDSKEALLAQGQNKEAVLLSKVAFESLLDAQSRINTGKPAL